MAARNETKGGSRVRVGVRVRPLSSHEVKEGGNYSLKLDSPTIRIGQRMFTYDAVFDANYGQAELYESISTRLISSFIDGYNATIMAYGQTGSGKTFTMGSEAHVEPEASSQVGLIPRFITDFFLELQRKKAASDKEADGSQILLDYSLKASFLEVYGEDVYDLLDANRCSLPLREDSKGGIVVVGLTNRSISNMEQALQVLHEGTMNRTTAATLMNLTSSRSHAVFTIHLSQVTRHNATDGCDILTTSQFTFVDLAGSERMKKTGAEGERAREGIKINEGLLALGNVINALADEDNMKNERKVHVPYRQSKLTRLLQDALGGNSQTLFLACVSPSVTNSSETLSTLKYANRARNIRNEPTKNIDGASAELERLKNINRILRFELVKSRFQIAEQGTKDQNEIGKIDESLLNRDDISAYMQQIYKAAGESTSSDDVSQSPPPLLFDIASKTLTDSEDSINISRREPKNRNRSSDKFNVSILDEINPDEEMAILDHLLELQQHDHEYEKNREQGDKELKEMSGELEKQETLLLQLRESLKVYHGLKGKYELLMEDVRQLEIEKSNLAKLLEKANIDPINGSSVAIKKKLEKVEINLSRARRETLNHRQKQRFVENQARKCKVLERKVNELKHAKSSLIRKQKEDAARHKKTTEAKTNELLSLRRRAKITDKRMSKLENELKFQKKNCSKRAIYCTKLTEKLKNTEKHLFKLLTMRQKNLSENKISRNNQFARERGRNTTKLESSARSLSEEEFKTTKYIFDRMVSDKVKQSLLKKKYEDVLVAYSETMRKVLSEGKALKEARTRMKGNHNQSVEDQTLIKDLEDNIVDFEFKLELLNSELQELATQMPNNATSYEKEVEDAVEKLMKKMSSSALKSMLLETFSKFVQVESERQTAIDLLGRKDAALIGVESEVDSLNFKLKFLSKDLADRRALEKGNDQLLTIKHLTDETKKYKSELVDANRNLERSNEEILQLKSSLIAIERKMMESKEDLVLIKASLKKEGGDIKVKETIAKLHQIWKELGTDSSLRVAAQKRIEFCLEDVCADLLNDANEMKCSTEKAISSLSSRLQIMKVALGVLIKESGGSSNKESLTQTLTGIQDQLLNLEVPYRYATARRRKIVEDLCHLMDVLGLPIVKLDNDLQILLQDYKKEIPEIKEKSWTQYSEADTEKNHLGIISAKSLTTEFLTRCEGHISKLRVAKSEMLLETRELQQKILVLMGEMHLNESQSLVLIGEWIKRNVSTSLDWWDSKVASDTLRDLFQTKVLSVPSKIISKHFEVINKALSTSADSRRRISETLRSVIERTQKTLLDIVGREIDASKACAGFNDALVRMPPLSKDLILSCVSELEALIDGIEAMAQTEIEALTVVWEALKISQKERRKFWLILEKSKVNTIQDNSNPFSQEHFQASSFHEGWMIDAVDSSRDLYRTMKARLNKLQGINTEVEKLRSKQDLKSQIVSLDSQIRIMNAKLIDFEELQCDKQRLLTKKIGGTTLLKEERFRKQMQNKFLSNLKQLVHLLRSWERKGNGRFDNSLLSDDVRELLKEDKDQMENWVDMRTKLMRLRTVKAPVLRSKSKGRSSPSGLRDRHKSAYDSGITPPRKRSAVLIYKSMASVKTNSNSIIEKNMKDSIASDRGGGRIGERTPKRRKRKQDSVPLPFGSILADSPNQCDGYNK